MKHHIWTPSLHPRGRAGRFTDRGGGSSGASRAARKESNRVADAKQAKVRRKAYRISAARAAGGAIKGGALVGIGVHTGDKRYIAAGAGRIGLAGAEAHTNFSNARRTTSKEFHKMNADAQRVELRRRTNRSANFQLASGAADFAGAIYGRKKLVNHLVSRAADKHKDRNWQAMKDLSEGAGNSPNHHVYSPYQGPGSHRAKAAGTSRLKRTKGVYNIRSENDGFASTYKVGKPAKYYGFNRKVGTGTTRAQRAAAGFANAKASARSKTWKASGGSTAVVLRSSPSASTAISRIRLAQPRTGRMGDAAAVRAAQKLGNKAQPRKFRSR